MKELERLKLENEELGRINSALLERTNADDYIEHKKNQTLYKRVGNKYVQANDPWAYEGLREGFWLVQVREGSTSIRSQVWPAKAAISAAARVKEEELVDIIRKASEARPTQRPISEQALKDWQKFIKKHGSEFSSLEYPSLQENAAKIIKALVGDDV
jgi:hypothetical protein